MNASKPLVVLIVYFGTLPPWLPITLSSMAANERVSFVVVGDAQPPAALPPNVRFETIGFEGMHARLSTLAGRRVSHSFTYKANDYKPFLPALYPGLVDGHEWWAWADLDVVFGDLLKYMALAEPHPACCRNLELSCSKKDRRNPRSPCSDPSRPRNGADTYFDQEACACAHGERVTAVSPLYPNPWRKKCWGPFTAFRAAGGALPSAAGGTELFRRSKKWQALIALDAYAHFDEWWGPYAGHGLETMGEAMTRLSDAGELVMSKKRLPFAEAKSCNDVECTFCPCGATRFELRGAALRVNGREVMVLHLAESKAAWAAWAATASLPPWAPPAPAAEPAAAAAAAAAVRRGACFAVEELGALTPDAALAYAGVVPSRRLRLKHHRPASAKAASLLLYASASSSHLGPAAPRALPLPTLPPLVVRDCAANAPSAAAASPPPPPLPPVATADVRAALAELRARYDAATAAEWRRAAAWLCSWAALQQLYASLVGRIELRAPAARKLPYVHGNRRVRTPLYGGERMGWATVAHDLDEIRAAPPRAAAACAAPPPAPPCVSRKPPPADGGGRRLAALPSPAARGRRLRANKRGWRGPKAGGPPPGVPCLELPAGGGGGGGGEAAVQAMQAALFDGYVHLHHVRRAEEARVQRWRCSWLYLMRACHGAEALLPGAAEASCMRVQPPNDAGLLGWLDADPTQLNSTAIASLLFSWRCW